MKYKRRVRAVSPFDELELKMSLSLTASVVHCMSSDISENNDPYFVGLKKLLFFQSFLPMKFMVCKSFFCKCDNVSKWIISC